MNVIYYQTQLNNLDERWEGLRLAHAMILPRYVQHQNTLERLFFDELRDPVEAKAALDALAETERVEAEKIGPPNEKVLDEAYECVMARLQSGAKLAPSS